jgi:hypothetical protein
VDTDDLLDPSVLIPVAGGLVILVGVVVAVVKISMGKRARENVKLWARGA